MLEVKEMPTLPPDKLDLFHGDHFAGSGYVYKRANDRLDITEIKLDAPKGSALDPFYYNKPIENPDNPFLPPVEFVKDKEPREGYYPLSIVEQALRPPNHLYEVDDAVFCAVNRGTDEQPQWETRYFPKKSLDSQVWEQAFDILEKIRPVEITTPEGLVLRQFTPEDAREIFNLIDRNRGHLSQHGDETADKYKTYEEVLDSIVHPKNPQRLRFAIRNKEGIYVGTINLTPDEDNPKKGEIGYYLGEEFTGKGYTKEALAALVDYAFGDLGYEELYAKVRPAKIASQKVLMSEGFLESGMVEEDVLLVKTK